MQNMSGWPKVAVIVLNWKGLADSCECLEALQTVTYPNYQTIVVDNGSGGDDVRVLQEKFGHSVHIIENDRNSGFAGGCNIGMTYALDGGGGLRAPVEQRHGCGPRFSVWPSAGR